jgi:hypothetical protein
MAPARTDPLGAVEVREAEDVEEFGASGRRRELAVQLTVSVHVRSWTLSGTWRYQWRCCVEIRQQNGH